MVMNLLKSINTWLQDQIGDEISYEAFKEILDNSAQVSQDRAIQTIKNCNEHKASCLFWSKLFIVNFFVCPPSLVFIGFRSGLSIRYCIEEVHECKLRHRTHFCKPKQAGI